MDDAPRRNDSAGGRLERSQHRAGHAVIIARRAVEHIVTTCSGISGGGE